MQLEAGLSGQRAGLSGQGGALDVDDWLGKERSPTPAWGVSPSVELAEMGDEVEDGDLGDVVMEDIMVGG